MSYAKENEIAKRNVKKWKMLLAFAVVLVLAALGIFGAFYPPDTWKYYFAKPETGARAEGQLRIHFVDVGQGDSTIIELPDGKTMLIDGGDDSDATQTALLRYLNALKIDTIDYLLVTHADADHCGALDAVLEHKEIKRAFLPVASETENERYAQFYAALMKEGCPYEFANRAVELDGGAGVYPYKLVFLYPYTAITDGAAETPTDDNAASVVVWLDYMGKSALFTGDAPTSTEEQLMRDDKLQALAPYGVDLQSTEILKVAHHGSKDSTSAAFAEYLGVETAVISCGADNAYGHPSTTVCQNLTQAGAEIYRTDISGSVIVTVEKDGTQSVKTLGK